MGIRPHALALEAARREPTALVPCPECAVVVGAAKVSRHLEDVHPVSEVEAELFELRGDDLAFVLPVLSLGVVGFVTAFVLGAWVDSVRVGAGIGATFLVVAFLLAALAWTGAIRSRVRLTDDAIELRYAFGALRRRVSWTGARVEAGTLVTTRPPAGSTDANVPHDEVRAGAYVRVSDGTATITFAHRGAGLRKRWSTEGVRQGPRRAHADVRLPTHALVAIEHALHAAGALKLRRS